MTPRAPVRFAIWLTVVLASAVFARGQTYDDYCYNFTANYDFAGWQAPGPITGGGTWGCGPGDTTLLFHASHDAYTGALRRMPETANLVATLKDLVIFAFDGTQDDSLSLLFHWRDPVYPAACCDPIHGSGGLRVTFSLARNRMEVYQETAGQSLGPIASLPYTVPVLTLRDVSVAYEGPLLSLYEQGRLIGTLEVPASPVGRYGFDLRHIDAKFSSHLQVECTAPGDYDCDGVPDLQDNCPGNPNADQVDLDGDGAGDACDLDDDGDGVPDLSDRCPRVSDPAQTDSDGDGLGDACDSCPTDASNDVDKDGICGAVDNCPADANPDQADFDSDGAGDLCDSNDGLIIARWSNATHLRWGPESTYDTYNIYRGDVDVLRATGTYVVDPVFSGPLDARSCMLLSSLYVDTVTPMVGHAAYYFVTGARGGSESGLGSDSAGSTRPNDHACMATCDGTFTTVVHGSDGPATAQYRVIDNLADWCAFRPSACGSGLIDFSTEVAVVAAAGSRSNSCNDVQVVCVRPGDASVATDVTTQEWYPGAGCSCFQVFVNPIHVVKMPRPAGPVTFAPTSAPLVCP